MTKMKPILAALAVVAAVAFMAPAAHAHACAGNAAITCHAIGAGSSAQFLTAMIGADAVAYGPSFTSGNSGATCTFHWSAKNAANVLDPRDGAQIKPELGNVWVVWIAACGTPNTGITDIWLDVSVDSTVGVRTFMAENTSGAGDLVQIPSPAPAPAQLVAAALLADGEADVALAASVQSAIGAGTSGNDHINWGLTDIRPEDALFATARAYAGSTGGNCATGTCTELGYGTSDSRIGIGILTDQGTGTAAYPTAFALTGTDPFTGLSVRSYTTVPVGAAPIVFVYNHGTEVAGVFPTNLVTGITPGKHVSGQAYPLANLFDGTTSCAETNPAFGSSGTGTANITLALREGLSGTMNTTEWTLFRSFGNTNDSQEKGIKPSLGSGAPGSSNNPLDLNCAGGGGKRVRGIGTGEIASYVNATANGLGYIFFSFSNFSKVVGKNPAANYNYLTLDGVDGVGITTTTNQELYNCAGPTCSSALWPSGVTFPHLRDGTYKSWSLYRWLVDTNDDDALGGPSAIATNTQNVVDSTVADYVPFTTTNASDLGLDVYRSHYKRCLTAKYPCPSSPGYDTPNDGSVSGNTLGGGPEAGGDMGGLVEGPFPGNPTVKATKSSATIHWVSGPKFATGTQWDGLGIILGGTGATCAGGTEYTISSVTSAAVLVLTTTWPGATGDVDACTPPVAVLKKTQ